MKKIRLYTYLLYFKKDFVLRELLAVLSAICVVLWSYFMALITKNALSHSSENFKTLIFYAIGFLAILSSIKYLYTLQTSKYTSLYKSKLYNDMFAALFDKNNTDFKDINSGNYISIMTTEFSQVQSEYFDPILFIIEQIIYILVASIAMFLYDWRLLLSQIVISILPFIQSHIIGHMVADSQKNFMENNSVYISRIKDFFNAHEYLSLGRIKYKIFDQHSNINRELVESERKRNIDLGKSEIISNIFLYLNGIIFLLFAGYLVSIKRIDMAVMMGAMQISNYITSPVILTSRLVTRVKGIAPIVAKFEKVLNEKRLNKDKYTVSLKDNEELLPIILKDLTVQINEKNILTGINLSIEKGKKYAIVGQSGCGKSTLLKSLLGYYSPENMTGNITYNGEDILNKDPICINGNIAYIEQKVFLLEGSLLDNITLFDTVNESKIGTILKAIKADRFLYDNNVDNIEIKELGNNLSGGEIQKIAIARALYQNKDILLCDEITANIDIKAANDINNLILKDENLTVLSISHQLNKEYLNLFDEVIFLSKGKVEEKGPFNKLLDNQGSFYYYWKLMEGSN